MIELTVKTLDSQNHGFSVPDDTTVKQLKEKIAESINIPADSQRLIYCGRVLVDEKNLSEYDVNGKVIHLVHRPPPQTSRPNGNNSGNRSTTQQQRRTNHRQPRMDGNAMYLGAMAFPADLMDAQGIQPPQPSHNLSQSRLIAARRMVRRASAVLQRLECPGIQESTDPETPPEDSENGSASNGENGGSGGSNVMPQAQPFAGSIAQAAQAATAAAIAAAVSAAHAAGVPNITIVRGGQPQGSQETVNIRIEGSGSEEGARTEQDPQVSSSEAANVSGSASAQAAQQSSEATSTSGGENQNRRYPRTSDMASLLDDLNRVTERMQPFLQQYHQLMRDDPVFEADSPALQDAQRVFNSVSEVMHFLSHAYHAMSDIMCEFSCPPPRNLRCRPVLIQHSAVLQAGIPIQAQINVMANRPNANNTTQSAQADNENSTANSSSIPSTANVARTLSNNASPGVQTEGTASSTAQTQEPAQAENTRPSVTQAQSADQGFVPQPTINITPGNVEFFMEVGPGSITIDSLEATVVTNGNASGAQGGVDPGVVGNNFPWGAPPPPEFIQNLMQAVAGHVIGRTSTAQNSTITTQQTTGTGVSAGGQNSQARGNTATHPTTSTQTRSTSRPHVHLAPATMQGLGSTNFDPFLPCNSHHVRTFRRRQRIAQQVQQQSTTTATSTEPQAETQTPEPATEQQQQQSQPPQDSSSRPQLHPQSQSQSQTQSQSQQQSQTPQNLLNFISNMIGNIRAASPGMGMGSFSFQVPPPMHIPPPPRPVGVPPSTHSSTTPAAGAGPGPENQFPGLSFLNLMNVMSGQGTSGMPPTMSAPPPPRPAGVPRAASAASTGSTNESPGFPFLSLANMMMGQEPTRAGETPPFNVPMMSQMFENLSGSLGGAFLVQGSGPTLADLLQSIPDHSYTEGESIFADLAMTLARSLTFQDLIAQRFGQVDSLNHIRPQLREFVGHRILQGESPTPENIARGADRLLREMRPHFDIMLEARLREEVDIIATANQYNQIRLPEVITLIMTEGNDNNFGQELVRWCRRYIGEMSAILMHCCIDKVHGLETIMKSYVQRLTSGVHPTVQQWTIGSSVTHLRNYISQLDVPFEDIQRYLVYRIPDTAEPPVSPTAPVESVQQATVQAEHVETTTGPEPMETDGISTEATRNGLQSESKDEQERNVAMDTDTLPDVLLGSETWHSTLPSEWVPIITRDTQRQRRQNPQPPFSDAYLTGMPSKRRKIVTSAKPQGSLSQIIADSVGNAVDAAGVDAVTGLETVTQVAGNDPEIQAAYREQVRVSVRESLASNPDFSAEQFPNTAKYFK
ncbi:large proline-rich protein BAG6 isoform X2 [Periplaneta americana]|uniref:large proline-rich protein BAG6 isoform X2 n=1 Tax=Periplaneta americana TaxID=6978 RepID=UPI0037E9790C